MDDLAKGGVLASVLVALLWFNDHHIAAVVALLVFGGTIVVAKLSE
jgi:hypothetical protein